MHIADTVKDRIQPKISSIPQWKLNAHLYLLNKKESNIWRKQQMFGSFRMLHVSYSLSYGHISCVLCDPRCVPCLHSCSYMFLVFRLLFYDGF